MSPKQTLRIVALLVLVAALAAGSVARPRLRFTTTWNGTRLQVAVSRSPPALCGERVSRPGAASPPQSASPHFAVSGGYWYSGIVSLPVYLPLALRGRELLEHERVYCNRSGDLRLLQYGHAPRWLC